MVNAQEWLEIYPSNANKLTYLKITNNNLSEQDLAVFSKLVNLEELKIGSSDKERINQGTYNRFAGNENYPKEERSEVYEIHLTEPSLVGELDLGDFTSIFGVKAQEYVDQQYPNKEAREKVTELDIKFEVEKDEQGHPKLFAQGGFSKIYKAKCKKIKKYNKYASEDVVLKSLTNSQNLTLEFLNEIANTKLVDGGGRIVKCYGISQDPEAGNYLMVMQYKEGGNLRQILQNKNKGLSLEDKIIGFSITDLGLCQPVNSQKQEGKIFGVLPYVAPEVLQGQPYTQASDIYSWGIIAYELFANSYPYTDKNLTDTSLTLAIYVERLIPKKDLILGSYMGLLMVALKEEYNNFSQNTPYQIHPTAITTSKMIDTKQIVQLLQDPTKQQEALELTDELKKMLVIEDCPKIKKLNVRKNLLTSLEFLANLENLEELEIDDIQGLVKSVKENPRALSELKKKLMNKLDDEIKNQEQINPIDRGGLNTAEIELENNLHKVVTKKDELEKLKNEFVDKSVGHIDFDSKKKEKIRNNLEIYLASVGRQDNLAKLAGNQARDKLLKGKKEDSEIAKLLNKIVEKQKEISSLENQKKYIGKSLTESTQILIKEESSKSEKSLEYRNEKSEIQDIRDALEVSNRKEKTYTTE
ncbi:2358_t:CDS:10, partial [Ambispora leptoticha]